MPAGDSAAARFRPGDTVRVKTGAPPGHFRTPAYIQGKVGRVERVHGAFRLPESLAYGGDGLPKQFLYLVGFANPDVWPGRVAPSRDKLLVDIYEHWLEPATGDRHG